MLQRLRISDQARQDAWPGGDKIDLSFRGLELGGEVGELLNKIKKLVRLNEGIQGQVAEESSDQRDALMNDIADELSDVVICADLIAMHLGISLVETIPTKFNKTSDKNGIPVYFSEGSGADAIAAERQRQMDVEGWTPEHDDTHVQGEMAHAAAIYARNPRATTRTPAPHSWPWSSKWWKPKSRRENLVRAGALIAAEIDRLDRLNQTSE